ncbi:MAG: hypothetical protein IJW28_00230 [Clostridia bacterium]|nr:hypothetical protein [Clostridia bacterium]
MASFSFHLLIAEEYLKLHSVSNEIEFIEGSFAPDMTEDKSATHYSTYNNSASYTTNLKNKVNLSKYVKENDINTSFKKGEFLHLFTDYVFYTQYMIKLDSYKKLSSKTNTQLNNLLYKEYDRLTHWLRDNYTLKHFNMIPEKFANIEYDDMTIFDDKSLKRLINYLVDVDLDRMYNIIKNTKGKFSLDISF